MPRRSGSHHRRSAPKLERYKETLGKLQKGMIRQLNDRLRTTGQGGRLLVTRGVMERGEAFVAKAHGRGRAGVCCLHARERPL